jgi:dihydrofolate reductase
LKKIIIAAISKNNVIGKEGKIPWHSKEELQHFKKNTIGFPVIMGRKTWEAISAPLEGRLNIIVTENMNYVSSFHEAVVFYSLKHALDFCKTSVYEKVYIIGGGNIFKQAIDEADEMLISEMNFEAEGDVYFPEIDGTKWIVESNEMYPEFTVHHYIRKQDLE